MSTLKNNLLWLDLETTGEDENNDYIIEIGCVLARLDGISSAMVPQCQVLSTFEQVTRPNNMGRLLHMAPEVVDLHAKSGLLADLLKGKGENLEEVQDSLLDWLHENGIDNNDIIPLAGSGVSHFDRRFLKRWMPKLAERLTYWAYDVGVMRRMFQLVNMPLMDRPPKAHRALADAQQHMSEFNEYVGLLYQLEAINNG